MQLARGAVMREQLELRRVVAERRGDLLAVELVVTVATHAKRAAERIEEAAHAALLAADREVLAPRIEVRLARFDERNAVVRLVVAVAGAEESVAAV